MTNRLSDYRRRLQALQHRRKLLVDFNRGVFGNYHIKSEAHLARSTVESGFRCKTSKVKDAERADAALIGAVGKRLTYQRTNAA